MNKRFFWIILSLCLIFSSFLSAQEDETFQDEPFKKSKSLFLSCEASPAKAYVGEVFPVRIKAIISDENFDDITNNFSPNKYIEITNPEAKWQWYSDNIFYNTFYIKAKSQNVTPPTLNVSVLSGEKIIETEQISFPPVKIFQLKKDKYFSNVIAESLVVKKDKTTVYDEKNLIIVLEIEATNSNLKDFSLEWVVKDNIDSFLDTSPVQKIYYYAIIPKHQQNFEFTYFDTKTNKYIKNTISVVLDSDEVSTQIGLNPKESSFQLYKSMSYAILAGIIFLIFLKRRKFIYLLFSIAFTMLFFFEKTHLNAVVIAENTNVMILPTAKSSVFYTTEKSLHVEKLGQKNGYIKILLPNSKIGWVKETNVVKN
ncbi:MAG: hypothetical protein PHW07_08425 [Sulfurospirillaceae bacterium]|nr:hypothetical protein [Sulfurospirillaceae bacterium]